MVPTVAVVGAGASGVLTALHLLSSDSGAPMRVVLCDGRGTVGRGIAYSTTQKDHLLNVRAGRMSAYTDRPRDFVDWLDLHGHDDTSISYVSRMLFGQYLEDRLNEQIGAGRDVEIVVDDVVDIDPTGNRPELVCRGGRRIAADAVVLATGLGVPGIPAACQDVAASASFIADPWGPGSLEGIGTEDPVVVMGTGLTSIDVLLTLAGRQHRGPIRAFSRHGLAPLAHRAEPPRSLRFDGDLRGSLRGASAAELVGLVRDWVRRAERAGEDWRDVVDMLRQYTAFTWENLSPSEQARFFRHVERYWDVHRHRMAPAVARTVDGLLESGQLEIIKGRLVSAEELPDGIAVEIDAPGEFGPLSWSTSWLVNCTGPSYGAAARAGTLPGRLTERGLLRPGPFELGVETAGSGQVVGNDGTDAAWLWAIGPLRRGSLYETTAVPEIRVQAQHLAAAVRSVLADRSSIGPLGHLPVDVDGDADSDGVVEWARPRSAPSMEIVTCDSPDIGDRSYLVHDGRFGLVIDPQCDIDRIQAEADRRQVTITHVMETHVHNDYVSGGLALSRRTGSAYVLSADEPVSFDRTCVRHGDTLEVGGMSVEVVHTPGHTPHHLSFVVRLGSEHPALFSGGSMLYDATGRTDLFDPEATEMLARAQWRSVRNLAHSLDPDTLLHPTHGFGSFCSSGSATAVGSMTVGEQALTNPALMRDETSFVEQMIRDRRPFPRYYSHMAPLNRRGACMSSKVSLRRTSLDGTPNDPDRVVVDLRPRREFAESHWPGAINVELGQSFAAYFGWSVPWGARVILVDDEWGRIEHAAASLRRIGIFEVEGALHRSTGDESSFRVVDFATLKRALSEGLHPQIVDARDRAEWNDGHIVGAASVPFYCSEAGAALLPRDTEVWVHCARGYRAAIAASLLQRHQARPVLVDDVFENAVGLGLTNSLASALV